MQLEAMVLCGGLGRRLRPAVSDRPKCLAPLGDRPFLEYLLAWLKDGGTREVCLCVGHMAHPVEEHFGDGRRWDLDISYAREHQPLGTGGAVRNAAFFVRRSPFLVLNGDSILDVSVERLVRFHQARKAAATMGLARVSEAARYGSVRTDAMGRVVEFGEKRALSTGGEPGWINGGVYVMERETLSRIPPAPPAVSLESDVFPDLVRRQQLYAYASESYFIDIGVPEAYARAQRELPQRLPLC